ncbi:MAG: PAS domain S-box protein [Euryarchaeota archaeon]|nr:PAS domain S-box protein [Euryarchaeota archaeon]
MNEKDKAKNKFIKELHKKVVISLVLLSVLLIPLTIPADEPKTLRVGVYENSPKIFTQNDNVSGFWADIIEHIASEEGWEIEWVHGSWAECLERLEKNEIDIMPDVAYTGERSKKYAFQNEIVCVSWSRVYVPEGSEIQSLPDLKNKKIAVLKGSVNYVGAGGIKELVENFDIDCTFIEADDYNRVFELVEEGTADAGVVNKNYGNRHEKAYDVGRTAIVFQPIDLKFAFPKNSSLTPYLIERIDYHMKELKEDKSSIYYQSIEKYFEAGVTEKDVVPKWLLWVLTGMIGIAVFFVLASIFLERKVQQRTKKLKKEKDFSKTLIQASPVFFVAIDAEGKTMLMNEAMLNRLRYSEEEVAGKDYLLNFVPEEDRKSVSEIFGKLIKDKEPTLNENRILTKYGEELLVEWRGRPVLDEEGNFEYFFGVGIDITERKRMEEALRDSEQEKTTILNNTSELITYKDNNLRIIWANRAAGDSVGLRPTELIGQHCYEVWYGRSSPCEGCPVLKAMETGEPQESEMTTPEGRVWLIRGSPVKDEDDRVIGAVEVTLEITERKRGEEKLKKSEERYRTVFENTGTATCIIEEDTTISLANKKFEELSRYSREEIEGKKSWTEFVVKKDLERMKKYHEERRKEGGKAPIKHEFNFKDRNGKVKRIFLAIDIIPRTKKAVASLLDITEREKARKEAEFYADVLVHDIGNLDQIILGYLHVLKNAEDEETKEKNARGIKRAVMDSKRLTESIRILKEVEEREIKKINLKSSLEESIKQIKDYFDREIEVNLDIEDCYVRANVFLENVLFAFLKNAVEYTFHDPVRIDIRTEKENGICNVHIRDYGIGISEEKRKDILTSLEAMTKRTGMGLYLSKKVLESFNGSFTIKDVEKGTEIVISLEMSQ